MNITTSTFFLFVDVHLLQKARVPSCSIRRGLANSPTSETCFDEMQVSRSSLSQHALHFQQLKKNYTYNTSRFKFSNSSIPTCPICCCLWHTPRATCDFKKGHEQQQQTFGWLDYGWLEMSFESSSLSEQAIHWVEMRRCGFNFKLYSICHACKWPLFPNPWSQ